MWLLYNIKRLYWYNIDIVHQSHVNRVNPPFASVCVVLLPSCLAGAVSAVSLGLASRCALEAPELSSGPGRKALRSSPPQPSSLLQTINKHSGTRTVYWGPLRLRMIIPSPREWGEERKKKNRKKAWMSEYAGYVRQKLQAFLVCRINNCSEWKTCTLPQGNNCPYLLRTTETSLERD